MRAPDRAKVDQAYADWAKASEKLSEIRNANVLHVVDEARALQEAEELLQKYIELSQRFSATLN